jgi:hypothetical protein
VVSLAYDKEMKRKKRIKEKHKINRKTVKKLSAFVGFDYNACSPYITRIL